VLWLAVAATAGAQTTAPLRLTLEEAVARGIANSHRLAEARAREAAAGAVVYQRHAESLPQVGSLGSYVRTNHVDAFGIVMPPNNQLTILYPDLPNNYRARVDMQWPVYTAGRLDALERAARLEATATGDDVVTARVDLTLEITRAYWAVVTAGEALRVSQEALQRTGAHLRDVRNQLNIGLVPPSDVLTVEAQEAHQRMLVIQARAARDVNEAGLARLVGAPSGTPIEPDVRLELAAPPAKSIDALVAIARQQRPERAALVGRVAAAGARTAAAAAGRRPTVAAAASADYARPNPFIFPRADRWRPSWDAGLRITWPVFDGGLARAETAEAEATARAVEERLADLDEGIEVDLRQRLSEIEAARAAVEAADVGIRSATEALRVLNERFAAGVATNTDVLDAQLALLQAELDRTRAIASARLADAQLARALGQ